jgi:hypothetical protein
MEGIIFLPKRLDLAWLKNRIRAASEGKTFHRFLHLNFPDFVEKTSNYVE